MLNQRKIEKSKYEKIYGENLRYDNTGELYGSLCHGKKVLDYIKGISFQTVLDVGCGRGQWAEILKGLGKKVSATDISEALISQLKLEGVDFRVAPMWDLPFEDKQFDLVTSFEVLEHIPEEELDCSFEELRRVGCGNIITSVAWHEDHKFGMDLHVTIKNKDWWLRKLSRFFQKIDVLQESQYGMFIHLKYKS